MSDSPQTDAFNTTTPVYGREHKALQSVTPGSALGWRRVYSTNSITPSAGGTPSSER